MDTEASAPVARHGAVRCGFLGLEKMAHSPVLEARAILYCVAAYLVPVVVQFGLPPDPAQFGGLRALPDVTVMRCREACAKC